MSDENLMAVFNKFWRFFTIVKPLLGTAPNVMFFYLFGVFCWCITNHCNDAKVTTAMLL
jgi:hypothetical protein